MKTLIRDDEPFVMREESDDEARDGHGKLSVSSYTGRDRVEIDTEALREFISKIRAKLLV